MEEEDYEGDDRGALIKAKDAILIPLRTATSKPARRAYISTALFLATSLILAALAITAYTLFYYAYIPVLGFERVVHLQFDDPVVPISSSIQPRINSPLGHNVPIGGTRHVHPWGVASLQENDGSSLLVSGQGYDVKVVMTLPRTDRNVRAGNFMLDLKLLGDVQELGDGDVNMRKGEDKTNVLARSRRPATLTFYSPLVEYVLKAVEMPWYLLGWRKEAETLVVDMMEAVEFGKRRGKVPAGLRLEVQSSNGAGTERITDDCAARMQVYRVKVVFRARFRGLRWLMYNHRIISFIIFTSLFWSVEMTFTTAAWLTLSFFIFGSSSQTKDEPSPTRIKSSPEDERSPALKSEASPSSEEEGDIDNLSDTSRTFPTSSRQPPLRYSTPKVKVKKEEDADDDDKEKVILQDTNIQPLTHAEADDEDEDADFVIEGRARGGRSDSGLGTSMESSAGRGAEGVKRRRSRGGGGGRGY